MAELSELIQDEGLTVARVDKVAKTIIGVMNVPAWEVPAEISKLTLAMEDDKNTRALRNAFGLTVPRRKAPAHSLTERRKQLLSSTFVSEATLRRWEKAAIDQLAQRILDQGALRVRVQDAQIKSKASILAHMVPATEVTKSDDDARYEALARLIASHIDASSDLDDKAKKAVRDALLAVQAKLTNNADD